MLDNYIRRHEYIVVGARSPMCCHTAFSSNDYNMFLSIIFKHHLHQEVSDHASIPRAVRGVYFFSYS